MAAEEVVELLKQLVAIDSVNSSLVPGGAGESAAAAFIAEWAADAGLEAAGGGGGGGARAGGAGARRGAAQRDRAQPRQRRRADTAPLRPHRHGGSGGHG